MLARRLKAEPGAFEIRSYYCELCMDVFEQVVVLTWYLSEFFGGALGLSAGSVLFSLYAKQAYARAIRLDPGDHLTRLNAAITLFNAGDADGAREMFEAHDQLWGALDEDGKVDAGEDVDEQRRALRDALYGS